MISFPLFKRNMSYSLKVSVIFIAILAMYTTIIIYMFDPEMAEMLKQYQEMMPGMMSAVGMTGATSTLTEFINTYLYGFIMLIIPMIFEIIIVNHLLMKYVDSGSMACLLATPNSRKKIITTQFLSIWLSILFIIVVTTIIGIVSSEAMFAGELEISKYIQLNVSVFFLHLAVSGIAFFGACFFNESKGYFAVGAGIPILFYLIQMLANMGDKLDFLKYFTLYTLFPGDKIMSGDEGALVSNIVLVGIAVILYVTGIVRFIKKDLSI
jgi:ABC-2 type transport system permease protein